MASAGTSSIDSADVFVSSAPALADYFVVAPLAIGFIFGALCLMQRKNVERQIPIALTGLTLMLLSDIGLFWHVLKGGTVFMAMGRWLPPYGIAFTADMMSATFALLTGIIGFVVGIYAINDADKTERRYGFYPFLLLMLSGVTAAFVTGDIFNLYVWFEVLLIGSFGLLILGSRTGQLDGGTKYAYLNLIGTTLFLIATAYLYGIFGSLNMADIARKSAALSENGPRAVLAAMFFFAFAMKAAAFPVNFWLPASYHTPLIATSAVFAGLLTKVGVYALLRIFLTLFPMDRAELAMIIAVLAALTMVLGALGALAQTDIRRALGYIVISGIGNMLAGLALANETALSGTLYYAGHSIVLMTALYMVVGLVGRASGTFSLASAGGLYQRYPMFAFVSLALFVSASGLPPFSGLWAKLYLLKGAIDVGIWWLAASILVAGLLSTIALIRIFALAFWRPAASEPAVEAASYSLKRTDLFPVLALLALSVAAGVFPEPFTQVTDRVAAELLSPASYVSAVFGANDAVIGGAQ